MKRASSGWDGYLQSWLTDPYNPHWAEVNGWKETVQQWCNGNIEFDDLIQKWNQRFPQGTKVLVTTLLFGGAALTESGSDSNGFVKVTGRRSAVDITDLTPLFWNTETRKK